MTSGALRILLGTAVLLLVGACAGPGESTSGSPSVRPGGYGLETRLWPVDDPGGAVARALLGYGQGASPVDARTLKRLHDSGLRAVLVPSADLEKIASGLRFRGQLEEQAAREQPEWNVLISGRPWKGYVALRSADGNLVLGPGRLRLLGRAWIAPGRFAGAKTPAVLRVELMVRHVETREGYATLAESLAPRPRDLPATEGLGLDSLRASFELADGQSLVIIPEDPDVKWEEAARLPNYVETQPERSLEQAGGSGAFGPLVPRTPALGQALLSDALVQFESHRKAIIVLVARVPDEFRLLHSMRADRRATGP